MATDDFSFSATPTHKIPSIDSPPLWRSSPAATFTDDVEEEDDQCETASRTPVEKMGQLWEESMRSNTGYDHDIDEEEKMDMLWEEFNHEELYSSSRRSSPTTSFLDHNNYLSGQMLRMGCGGGVFNLTKSNAPVTTTKPGAVEIIKLLKRLFFLHNSHHHNLDKRVKW